MTLSTLRNRIKALTEHVPENQDYDKYVSRMKHRLTEQIKRECVKSSSPVKLS